MDHEQVCFYDYRVSTFAGSIFEKNRRKECYKNNKTLLKQSHLINNFHLQMAEAGFYFNPNDKNSDRVNCYACGIEVYGWDKNEDDPW